LVDCQKQNLDDSELMLKLATSEVKAENKDYESIDGVNKTVAGSMEVEELTTEAVERACKFKPAGISFLCTDTVYYIPVA
jgi:hypothetical protein